MTKTELKADFPFTALLFLGMCLYEDRCLNVGTYTDQRKASDTLEPELQMAVKCQIGSSNQVPGPLEEQ